MNVANGDNANAPRYLSGCAGTARDAVSLDSPVMEITCSIPLGQSSTPFCMSWRAPVERLRSPVMMTCSNFCRPSL